MRGLALGAPDCQPLTQGAWDTEATGPGGRGAGGGGVEGRGFPGRGAAEAEARLAGQPQGELSRRGTEPGCPCDCGVLWKRKL